MIAMRIAARYPALVERLVLVNTSARAEYPDRLEAWRERRAELLAGEAERASAVRSEEDTSELQSLMRNSYAVFCLKNKTVENTRKKVDKSDMQSRTHK